MLRFTRIMNRKIMNNYIIYANGDTHKFNNILTDQYADVGGKAKNLLHLKRHGLPVPDFICLNTYAYLDSIKSAKSEIQQQIDSCDFKDFNAIAHVSETCKKLVYTCGLLPDVKSALARSMNSLQQWPFFSVRSSATNEDSSNNSFAGQLQTFLHVKKEDIEQRVLDCWASAFDPGVLSYLHRLNINPLDNPIAVVVQRMVNAESSGVLFQASPDGDVSKKMVVAGYGLGEGIVADKVESDLYIWDKFKRTWSLTINHKTKKIQADEQGGIQQKDISEELGNKPVLSDSDLKELIHHSEKIAVIYDHYQDIEWSFDESGKLYILQSRPITTIPKGMTRGFDSSNIAESYPGVISPATFSLLHRDYYRCVKGVLAFFGVPSSVLAKRDYDLRRLVGYIDGHAFYNINNWYRTLLLSPFFKTKIVNYFEEMIGSEGSYFKELNHNDLTLYEKAKLSLSFPFAFIKNTITHKWHINHYFKQAEKLEKAFLSKNLNALSSDELIGYLDRYSKKFTELLSIPILNDFYTMIFMSLSREVLQKVGADNAGELLNRLLIEQKVESSKPVESLQSLTDIVRDDLALGRYLESLMNDNSTDKSQCYSVSELLELLQQHGYSHFGDSFVKHIERYGHRCPKELILEHQTFRENPQQLLKIIISSAKSEDIKRNTERGGADHELATLLSGNRWKRLIIWLINRTKQSIAYREATRLDRGLHFSFFRQIYNQIGGHLQNQGLIEAKDDVFMLSIDELEAFRSGCTPDDDLKSLIAHRHGQEKKWLKKDPQERIFTSGVVYANSIPMRSSQTLSNKNDIAGLGCSEGVVTAKALCVSNPNDVTNIEGRILISETTDPGWVFLMNMSAGLISERGSLLSHTAIIGRELGIPTIVGVKNASRIITSGETITMDGKTGQVYRHNSDAVTVSVTDTGDSKKLHSEEVENE